MKIVIFCLLALALVTLAFAEPSEHNYQAMFGKWMRHHQKSYAHDEFQTRYQVFKKNFDYIHNFNKLNNTYTLAVNQFADLTNQEFNVLFKGLATINKMPMTSLSIAGANPGLPASVDWRTKGVVTAVKNQGQCGSCWSFSTTGSVEGAHAIATNNLVSLSEQNLVDCSTAQGNQGCNGGLMDDAFQYIISNGGIDTEASYPYTATGPNTCQYNPANSAATISGYQDIPSGSESSLQSAVASVGPVSVAIDASQSSFQFYSGGVYSDPNCSSSQLDHGVLAAGYGTYQGTDYWLVKNSWGASWGLSGYIMMARNANNACGIATAASYPTGAH